ncbi:MAG: putative Ig domain-containing protein, partial [Anaerolineaceae bacterium]
SLFQLDGDVLRTAQTFDHESAASYTVRVRSTDQGGLWYEEFFTIHVDDVNEGPSITSDGGADTASLSVPENSTAVTTVTADDPDADTVLAFSIVGGADQGKFEINPASGTLVFTAAPDFETKADADADNVYDVTVEVSDGELTDTQAIAVTVTNINESPADVLLDDAAVDENQPVGALVGRLSNADPDAGGSYVYLLVAGEGDTDNALFQISGDQLLTQAVFNYELKNSYAVRIRVQDQDGLTAARAFTLTVTDLNDIPVLETLIPDQTVQMNTRFSFTFDALTFSDEDGDELSYVASLSNGNGLPGWLTFNHDLRLFTFYPGSSAKGNIEVRVTASDGRGGYAIDTFFLSISAPGNIPPVQNYPLPDQVTTPGADYSYTIQADVFSDPDSTTPLVYAAQLSNGRDLPAWLSFNPASRTFSGKVPPGTVDPLTIRVIVFDAGGGRASDDFVLSFVSVPVNQTPYQRYHLVDQNAVAGTAFLYTFAP